MKPMIQQVANRYEIIQRIGQGGMADVYTAKDTILNRVVAIKLLREKFSTDPMILVRFQREASAASRLSHPNVVDIYDVGEYQGMHYIVMEYIKGSTLKELIHERGALDVKEAIHIMIQLTSAIKTAHVHNIIHRDIKPQNVLVKSDGTVKITDFGIAVANDAVQLTFNNAVMGSAHYLAPETVQGKEATPQIDIYSLGIVFFELLTGSVPFHGNTPTEIAIKHLREPMPYVRDFVPTVPQSVENIILKATAKNPENRYENISLMLYDLEHCLEPKYARMKRIHFDDKPVSQVNVKDGVVNVEYETEKKEEPPQKKKRNILSMVVNTILIFLIIVAIAIICYMTGLIRFSGMFGYETVPNVVNMDQDEAIETLEDSNFTNITVEEVASDAVDTGNVVSTNHESGSVVKSDTEIVVKVCKGPTYLVKDYTGQYLTDVEADLEEEGVTLGIEVTYVNATDTNPGVIMKQQELSAGDRIDPDANEKIVFIVSQYPEITIPEEVIGMDVDEAKDLLNDMGVAVVTRQVGSGSGVVTSTDPAVGSTYTQEGSDSVVTLYYD